MAILTDEPVQIIRGLKADIAQRTGSDGELNWATDSKELYIHDGKTRGGHLIGSAGGSAVITGGAGIAVSTVDGNSTISIKRDSSSVLYVTTDGAGVRLGSSGGLQVTAQNALDLHLAEGGGIVVDSNGLKVDSSVLTSVFRYAGQVNSVDDLPADASIGDVYDVKDSGANYVWTGSSWDNLGGIFSVDPSPTQGSTNPVASGGVYDAIQALGKQLQDMMLTAGDGISITDTSNQTHTITAVAAPRGGLTVAATGIGVNLADGGDFPSGLEIKVPGNLGIKIDSGIRVTRDGVSVRNGDGLAFDNGDRLIVDDTVLRTNKEQTITATKTFDVGYFGKTVAVAAKDISPVDGAVFTKTVTANTTFTISGTPSNVAACFTLVLTNGGSHTVTWPSSVKWTEGTPPELIAAGIDVITFITPNGGTTWYGCHSVQGVPA